MSAPSVNVDVWMTPREIKAVQESAAKAYTDFSSWIRTACLRWMDKRPRTRPPSPKIDETRTFKHFRVTKAQKRRMSILASSFDLTLSDWIRNVAFDALVDAGAAARGWGVTRGRARA